MTPTFLAELLGSRGVGLSDQVRAAVDLEKGQVGAHVVERLVALLEITMERFHYDAIEAGV